MYYTKLIYVSILIAIWMHVGTSMRSTRVDHALESIHNIREAFPKLWEVDEKHEIVYYKVAIETTVKA